MSADHRHPPRRSVDKPEADPNVKALGGFDVTALSVADLAAKGIGYAKDPILACRDDDGRAVGQVWMPHSEYAAAVPEHDAVDRSYARSLAAAHHRKHGTLEGLELPRSFPCLGKFRRMEGEPAVECDKCGDMLGVPLDARPPDPPEQADDPLGGGQDGIPF